MSLLKILQQADKRFICLGCFNSRDVIVNCHRPRCSGKICLECISEFYKADVYPRCLQKNCNTPLIYDDFHTSEFYKFMFGHYCVSNDCMSNDQIDDDRIHDPDVIEKSNVILDIIFDDRRQKCDLIESSYPKSISLITKLCMKKKLKEANTASYNHNNYMIYERKVFCENVVCQSLIDPENIKFDEDDPKKIISYTCDECDEANYNDISEVLENSAQKRSKCPICYVPAKVANRIYTCKSCDIKFKHTDSIPNIDYKSIEYLPKFIKKIQKTLDDGIILNARRLQIIEKKRVIEKMIYMEPEYVEFYTPKEISKFRKKYHRFKNEIREKSRYFSKTEWTDRGIKKLDDFKILIGEMLVTRHTDFIASHYALYDYGELVRNVLEQFKKLDPNQFNTFISSRNS